MAEKIHGIFTPHVVPLQPNGEIDEPELRRYIDWLIEKGVHGLYPNGSTGEFTRFTADERKRIIKIVCEQAAGRVPVLAGAAEANIRETLQACETAPLGVCGGSPSSRARPGRPFTIFCRCSGGGGAGPTCWWCPSACRAKGRPPKSKPPSKRSTV